MRSRADAPIAVLSVGGLAAGEHSFEPVSRMGGDVESPAGWRLVIGKDVTRVMDREVVTSCGERFVGRCVIDCRGRDVKRTTYSGSGYQKFYGFELELEQDWPSDVPLVMDAATDQSDGFRFFYTLPFTARRVLVEDTCFSDSPSLDRDDCLAKVCDYLASRGLQDFKIAREESGVLPMPYSGEGTPGAGPRLAGGYAGGWYHAATGYSFPLAVAFAQAIASTGVENARRSVDCLARGHRFQARFGRFLNRLLFRLVAREHRHRVFRRFYRVLDDEAVARFFAHRFYPRDAFRIVVGIPPTVLGLRPLRFFRSFLKKGHS
jgi:lycopene beta-cyclase